MTEAEQKKEVPTTETSYTGILFQVSKDRQSIIFGIPTAHGRRFHAVKLPEGDDEMYSLDQVLGLIKTAVEDGSLPDGPAENDPQTTK